MNLDHPLATYSAESGHLEPVWTLEIQTVAADVDRLLDAAMTVNPLRYGKYERNASVSAVGSETARPTTGTTTALHADDFEPGGTETYPMVEVKISIPRTPDALEDLMNALLAVHHYEEPVIFVREDWVSRAAYNPGSSNPHRWWNNGRGLSERIS